MSDTLEQIKLAEKNAAVLLDQAAEAVRSKAEQQQQYIRHLENQYRILAEEYRQDKEKEMQERSRELEKELEKQIRSDEISMQERFYQLKKEQFDAYKRKVMGTHGNCSTE